MDIIEKSRETVEQLLARRNLPKTYEEKCQYALDLVDMHLHEENPERIDECIKLYTEDAIWQIRLLATLAIEGGRRSRTCICACSTPSERYPMLRPGFAMKPSPDKS